MRRARTSVISAIITLVSLITLGTITFRQLEGWSWAESFYFSVATLTTVGYGDIHPTSDGSRVFTAFYILVGVGIVVTALTKVGSAYLSKQEHQLSNNIARRIHNKDSKN